MNGAERRRQAVAPPSVSIGADAFGESGDTTLHWLGMAGFLLNSRGTALLIDPVLHSFDMPLLIDIPLGITDVPRVDAVLVTHADNDHLSIPSCRDLAPVTGAFHSTRYVASVMTEEEIPGTGHDIGDEFAVGKGVQVTVCPPITLGRTLNPATWAVRSTTRTAAASGSGPPTASYGHRETPASSEITT